MEKRYSVEYIGEWAGVEIPEWLRAFDCRASEEFEGRKAPWGESLWGSERAAVDCGLKRGYGSNDATYPVSCSTYVDARKCNESEIAKQLRDGIKEATKLRAEYEAAKKAAPDPKGGGSCLYPPVAFALSNFGWSIISDQSKCIVRAFKS